jgi:carbon-monoxide dehydrogenase medium subunit
MKPPRFEYAAPSTVEESARLLAEAGGDAKVLAGGQSLMPMLNMRIARPDLLVDLNGVGGLDSIEADDGELVMGALVRHHDAATSDAVAASCPLIARAMPFVGHAAIRHRGTVVGSLAHADPAAELPAVAAALGATMVAASTRGERRISCDDFFRSWFTTALEPDELLTQVRFPAQHPSAGSSFAEVARRHGDFAQAGVAATLRVDGDVLRDVRLAALAVAPAPRRLTAAEAVLEGAPLGEELLEDAGAAAAAEVDPGSDMHSSADYRRRTLAALVARAVRDAADESRGRQR